MGAVLRVLLKHVGYFLAYGALGLVLALIAVYAWYLDGLPELRVWHTARLDGEFRAADATRVRSLAHYRALEDRLHAQLELEVYEKVPLGERRRFDRYSSGSLADPATQPVNWNRTFEFGAANPRGGVLLVHGLSDSPYSVRALAERLHADGYLVVGLRLPGHGTAPSALVHASWQDMAAAVRLAARDMAQRLGPEKHLHLLGYSTGAALAVEYALARLQGEELPPVASLVLISPAIGVSSTAALAVWQRRLSELLGIDKLAWTDLSPEYDPYKYASFPVNAAEQAYALTAAIAKRMGELAKGGHVTGLPRILAFQSAVDATVSAPAVLDALFRQLAPEGHALVVFDLNRHADVSALYLPGTPEFSGALLRGPALPFDLTVVTNADSTSLEMVLLHRRSGADGFSSEPAGLTWPPGIYSLSHVALPFSPQDPIYGATRPRQGKSIYLGNVEAFGERGILALAPGSFQRLRHNPFYDYLQAKIEAFVSGQ